MKKIKIIVGLFSILFLLGHLSACEKSYSHFLPNENTNKVLKEGKIKQSNSENISERKSEGDEKKLKILTEKSNEKKSVDHKTISTVEESLTQLSKSSINEMSRNQKISENSKNEISTNIQSLEKSSNEKQIRETLSYDERRIRLDVPQMIQQEWNYCAPTTVSMILAYKGIEVNQQQLAKEMKTDEIFGTHNEEAIRVLNKYLFGYEYPADNQAGYRLAVVNNSKTQSEDMTLFKERLIKNISDGYPMYFTVDNARLYPETGSAGEHNIVGTGYILNDTGTDIDYIYIIDPSYTQQDPIYGGLKIFTPEEFLYSMLTCVEPNYAW